MPKSRPSSHAQEEKLRQQYEALEAEIAAKKHEKDAVLAALRKREQANLDAHCLALGRLVHAEGVGTTDVPLLRQYLSLGRLAEAAGLLALDPTLLRDVFQALALLAEEPEALQAWAAELTTPEVASRG